MPQFPLCSEFIPLLDAVKNQLAELKVLSQEFLGSGDGETKQKAFLKSQELEKTKQQLIDLKEQPVEFEGKTVIRIEKELLIFFRNKLDSDLRHEIKENRVTGIRIDSRSKKSAEILEPLLKFVKLFSKLQNLACQKTQITTLPELPLGLQVLSCDNTKIITLPELPDSLQQLCCFNTQITVLPELPRSLQQLWCSSTQITSLPELPDSLQYLWCRDTPAAKNPETKKQLEEFKKNHPQFSYEIQQ